MPFVRHFVAVFGADAHTTVTLPETATHQVRRVTGPGFQLVQLDETEATLQPTATAAAPNPSVVVRGRPFALHPRVDVSSCLTPTDRDRTLRELDGRFSLLAHDGRQGLLTTDILAAGSLYWTRDELRLCASTSLGLLLRATLVLPPLDPLGTASLLAGYGGVNGRTPFANVTRLQSCEYVTFEFDEHSVSRVAAGRYGSLPDLLLTGDSDAGDDVDVVGELLAESLCREALPQRPGLPLSGGRDSTALALVLRTLDVDAEAVTFGDHDSEDLRQGRVTARKLKMRQRVQPYESWDLSTYADQIVAFGGGTVGLIAGSFIAGFEQCSDLMVSGFLGDALTGAHLPPSRRVPLYEDARRAVLFNFDRPLLQRHYGDELATLDDELRQTWEPAGLTPTQAHMLLDLTQRQASYISPTFDLPEAIVDMAHPWFSRRTIQFWFSRGPEALRRQALYDAWLGREKRRSKLTGAFAGSAALQASRRARMRASRRLRRRLRLPPHRPVPQTVDYTKRIERSLPWLHDTLARYPSDARLHRVCTESLQTPLADVPEALVALPLLLAIGGRLESL